MRRPGDLAIAAVTLGGVVAYLLVDWLLDGSRPEPGGYRGGDLRAYFVPAHAYARASLAAGELPLWNPYQLAGSPFLATLQPGVLNPLWWPFFLMPTAPGITGFVLLHLWLAGLFTCLYLRRLGVSLSAALAAALAYMLCYWVLSGPFNPSYGAAFAWAPAVFWALHRLLSDPGRRNAALLGTVIAVAFLAGHAQAFLYLAELASIYALAWLLRPGRTARMPAAGWALAAAALAALLCAAQILPTLELAADGTRSLTGLDLADAAMRTWTWSELWKEAWGGGGPVGLCWLTLPLALAALAGRHRLAHAVFFALALLALADFIRGADGIVFPIHFALPGGSVFRGAGRAGYLLAFAGAVLIGLGAQRIEDWLQSWPVTARTATLVSLLIAAAVGVDRYRAFDVKPSFLPLTAPESLAGPPELVAFGRRLGAEARLHIERYPNGALPYRLGQMHGFGSVPDYEPLLPGAYRRFFRIEGIWHGNLVVLPRPAFSGFLARPAHLDWLAVRFYADAGLLPKPRIPDPMQRIVGGPVVERGRIPVIERRQALPRAFVATRIEILPDESSVLETMLSRRASRTAFVTEAALAGAGIPARASGEVSGGAVEIVQTTANRVALRTRCAAPCFVVLGDLDHPGWEAHVDGQEVPVVRTNFLFRGAPVPAGEHELEFRYRPASFAIGGALSCVGLAGLVALLLQPRPGSRRSERASNAG